jgi:hypothetical protein
VRKVPYVMRMPTMKPHLEMRRRVSWSALAAFAIALLVFASTHAGAAAPANRQLINALGTLKSLSEPQFVQVVAWSRSGAVRPLFPSTPVERAEVQILNLPSPDAGAVLGWLRGNGRRILYDRGVNDAQIGPRRPANVSLPVATPTPNPYRTLRFAAPGLGTPSEQIDVLGGFAAVKRDGKAAIVCVSFKNVAPRTATRVLFEFPLIGANGAELGALELDRRGEFSPNVDINGWSNLSEWQSAFGHRGYRDNCRFVEQGVASEALLDATSATYRILNVQY